MQSQSRVPEKSSDNDGTAYTWFPIVIGGLVGLGLGFLLELLSVSMGLSLFTTDPSGARTLAIGGAIGMLVGTIAAMYATGFTAGYLAADSSGRKNLGILYGFAAWCLSLILMVMLATAIANHMAYYQVQFTAGNTVMPMSHTTSSAVAMQSTSEERNIKAAGAGSFVVFVLFFAGALSAAYGGHCGYKCRVKHQ